MISKKLNIEFVDHMGYYIPKSAVEGFDPETYFDGPIKDENGLCEKCRPFGYCVEEDKTSESDPINYQALNDRCENALKEINNHSIDQWLYLSSRLIDEVSIQPEGFPSIANATLEGVHYKFIAEFHRVYQEQLNNSNR